MLLSFTSGPIDPLALSAAATVTASFTDAGTLDTHTCSISWDDGQPASAGTVSESAGSGSCAGTRIYTGAGVYTISITVADDDAGTTTKTFQFVVVYDPSAGFVTGGGWINSPPGAYVANGSLTGKATFGFQSKYERGARTPTGQTAFQFHLADFKFQSTVYGWLLVSGAKAQYKGSGTVNGTGDYSFLLTVTDGDLPGGGGGTDKFRIKIWNKTTSALLYDNAQGASDDIDSANPQAISSGSIVIHTN
jgi:hypothetical protein